MKPHRSQPSLCVPFALGLGYGLLGRGLAELGGLVIIVIIFKGHGERKPDWEVRPCAQRRLMLRLKEVLGLWPSRRRVAGSISWLGNRP